MLTVEYKSARLKKDVRQDWWINSKGPELAADDEIISVQADGDELDYVKVMFTNIPFNNSCRVQIWHGEFARFIIRNFGRGEYNKSVARA